MEQKAVDRLLKAHVQSMPVDHWVMGRARGARKSRGRESCFGAAASRGRLALVSVAVLMLFDEEPLGLNRSANQVHAAESALLYVGFAVWLAQRACG
jgi:hypothetical protein